MKVAIGQDSHRLEKNGDKPVILAGVLFESGKYIIANSDGDVVYHAITNAISGITGKNILGKIADDMCKKGITNSEEYLKEALKTLEQKMIHLSISIEAKEPKISPKIEEMKEKIAKVLQIEKTNIGITATSGEGLTECGKGNGISAWCCLTVE